MDPAARPRILLKSVPAALVAEFDGLPGTLTFVDADERVHASDHDFVVTFGEERGLSGAWHVLAFGINGITLSTAVYRRLAPVNVARDVVVADNEEARAMKSLIERTILATLPPPPRRTWTALVSTIPNAARASRGDSSVVPLVEVGAEKTIYAFRAQRPTGRRIWVLPEHTTGHRAWLLHVLQVLHEVDPDRFPGEPDWQASTVWATPELSAAHEARGLAEERLQAAVTAAKAEVSVAEDAVIAARSAAVAGMWRLLTQEGDELVAAVEAVLTDLGFVAKNVDEENHERHGRRLEDLLVTDPEEIDWESLVEVKGYTKGAKVSDVDQVTRHPSMYFAIDHGRPPRTVWHVVNAWRGKDPTLREPTVPNDADLHVLTDAPGALIDTRDLFRAWCDFETGHAAAADVRASLRAAVTRWTWPAT